MGQTSIRTGSWLGSTYRNLIGSQWASEVPPTSWVDIWEDGVWPNGGPSTSWTVASATFYPCDEFQAEVSCSYAGPGPVYPNLVVDLCRWTSPGRTVIDAATYCGTKFGTGTVSHPIYAWNIGASGMGMGSNFAFSCCPEPVWKNSSSTGALPVPAGGAWYLRKGIWDITATVTPFDGDVTYNKATLALFPHRRETARQRRIADMSTAYNQHIFKDYNLLGSNTVTKRIELRASALWCPYISFEIRRPDGFSFSSGATAFDVVVSGVRVS